MLILWGFESLDSRMKSAILQGMATEATQDHTPRGILLFGGTFDPIHNGHVTIARWVGRHLGVDRTILIPAGRSPHKLDRAITPAEHRLAMVRLAVDGCDDLQVSDCEIVRGGASYTLETIEFFRKAMGDAGTLYWLIGADSLPEIGKWYRAEELLDACTVVTACRPGHERVDVEAITGLRDDQKKRLREFMLDTPRVDVSSTAIRQHVRDRLGIDDMVPRGVAVYIATHGLYSGRRFT